MSYTGTPKALVAGIVLAGAMFASTTASAATYLPVGPQVNVPINTVTSGGWTLCFSQPYGLTGTSVASAVSACTGDLLMMAGGADGTDTLGVLAFANKSLVLTTTAPNTVNNANGAGFYFNNRSWGFAPQGFTISQNTADTNSAPGFGSVGDDGTQRLSWHTGGDGTVAGTQLNGGWRVGNTTFLNSEPSGFTRYLFTANSQGVPEPATLGVLGAALALGAALRRRAR